MGQGKDIDDAQAQKGGLRRIKTTQVKACKKAKNSQRLTNALPGI
jgi:hypothetical protein